MGRTLGTYRVRSRTKGSGPALPLTNPVIGAPPPSYGLHKNSADSSCMLDTKQTLLGADND